MCPRVARMGPCEVTGAGSAMIEAATACQSVMRSMVMKDGGGGGGGLPRAGHLQLVDMDSLPDVYLPPFRSASRKGSIASSVFNLVCTIVGGGTLTLPFVVSKAGMGVGLLLIVIAGLASNATMRMLAICARKLGLRGYGEMAEHLLSPLMRHVLNLCIVVLLCFVIIAYMVILRGIGSSFVELVMGCNGSNCALTMDSKNLILGILLIVGFPLSTFSDLHELSWTCYMGAGSIVLLILCVAYRSAVANVRDAHRLDDMRWYPEQWSDATYVFPIIFVSYLCHFNVLPVVGKLHDPTPDRVHTVVEGSGLLAGAMYVSVGIAGYTAAVGNTADNILDNFPSDDPLLLLARAGLLVTIMCAIPVQVLPCRDSLVSLLPDSLRSAVSEPCDRCMRMAGYTATRKFDPLDHEARSEAMSINTGGAGPGPGSGAGAVPQYDATRPAAGAGAGPATGAAAQTAHNREQHAGNGDIEYQGNDVAQDHHHRAPHPEDPVHDPEEPTDDGANPWGLRVAGAAFIVGVAFLTTTLVPNVAAVWSICGSSVCVLVSFTYPAAIYIATVRREGVSPRHTMHYLAWVILVLSILGAVFFTVQALLHIANSNQAVYTPPPPLGHSHRTTDDDHGF